MNETVETPVPEKKPSFVRRHKVAIAVVTTSAFWIVMNRLALKQHNDFLKEKDLYMEFYTPEETE
jgi:hypothetical protein